MLFDSLDTEQVQVRLLNISFGGLLCQSPTAILPGSRVEVLLSGSHPGVPDLRLKCRVVRLERQHEGGPYEIALTFEDISDEVRRSLVRLVELDQGADI